MPRRGTEDMIKEPKTHELWKAVQGTHSTSSTAHRADGKPRAASHVPPNVCCSEAPRGTPPNRPPAAPSTGSPGSRARHTAVPCVNICGQGKVCVAKGVLVEDLVLWT